MRVHVIDPGSSTRPYDHALCRALGREGARIELVTSRFAYGAVPAPDHYVVREQFYRHARGPAGSRLRRTSKLIEHIPDMLRYRRAAGAADVVHFQWSAVPWIDRFLLPDDRPIVLTAHDLLPREPRLGQAHAQRALYDRVDAIVVHSRYGHAQLVSEVGLDPAKVHVIHHGAFEHLTRQPDEQPLPDELLQVEKPVVLFFGLIRPYKGIEGLLDAWRGVRGAELWIVGRPLMPTEPLQAFAPESVRFILGFVSDQQLPAYFRRADVVVLPYSRTAQFDQSGVLATALAFEKAIVASDIGGIAEVAATGAVQLVTPDVPDSLGSALRTLIADGTERARLAQASREAATGPYSWEQAAIKTLALYQALPSLV